MPLAPQKERPLCAGKQSNDYVPQTINSTNSRVALAARRVCKTSAARRCETSAANMSVKVIPVAEQMAREPQMVNMPGEWRRPRDPKVFADYDVC